MTKSHTLRRRPKQRRSKKQTKSRRQRGGKRGGIRGGNLGGNLGGKVVGKIYSNGCGHCVALEKPWEDLQKSLKGENIMFKNIEQNSMDKELETLNNTYLNGSEQKVSIQQGFPTIYKIDNGKVSYYDGIREMEPMKSWILI